MSGGTAIQAGWQGCRALLHDPTPFLSLALFFCLAAAGCGAAAAAG